MVANCTRKPKPLLEYSSPQQWLTQGRSMVVGCITLEHLYQDADDKSFLKFLQAGSLGTMPNLRSLKLNIDGKVADFNLASLLSGNLALQTLHIKLIGEGITGGRHKANVQGSGTALRHELQENLPMRLQNLVLQGEDIENIHPAAFKVSFKLMQ